MKSAICAFCASVLATSGAVIAADNVGPVPDSVRTRLELAPFYQKHVSLKTFSIAGSKKVSDYALLEAAWILRHMLQGRDDILKTLAEQKVHLAVMAWNEYTTDVPEHSRMKPRVFWDRRARGLGGDPVSCGEENLLAYPNDPYSTENLLIHEFAHAIHGIALRKLDPTFDKRLKSAYEAAKERGLWKATYAGTNRSEYWAEAVQDWFDDNRQNDSLHNHVNTRAELKEYDPALAALCAEVFGEKPWRYQKPMQRAPAERTHLQGFDASKSPRFRWRDEPIPDTAKVLIQTELGDVEMELDYRRAPRSVENFLRYVHQGYYNNGIFFRTVTMSNQPDDQIRIEVVQARADPGKSDALFPPIRLERTRDTGLKHTHGTISMARSTPNSAQDHFFVCIGDQFELDFGGKRNPDGQGFAAFGRVVEKDMEVVLKIQKSKATKQQLTPPIRIQRAIRLN